VTENGRLLRNRVLESDCFLGGADRATNRRFELTRVLLSDSAERAVSGEVKSMYANPFD